MARFCAAFNAIFRSEAENCCCGGMIRGVSSGRPRYRVAQGTNLPRQLSLHARINQHECLLTLQLGLDANRSVEVSHSQAVDCIMKAGSRLHNQRRILRLAYARSPDGARRRSRLEVSLQA